MISGRALEVKAVIQKLMWNLAHQHVDAPSTPPIGATEFREQGSDVQQAKRFTGQVSIRAVVNGVESIDESRGM